MEFGVVKSLCMGRIVLPNANISAWWGIARLLEVLRTGTLTGGAFSSYQCSICFTVSRTAWWERH